MSTQTRSQKKTSKLMKQVAWNIRKVSTPPSRRSPRFSRDYPPLPSPTCPASVITAASSPNKDASRLNSSPVRRNPMRRTTLNASSVVKPPPTSSPTKRSPLSSKRSQSTVVNSKVDSSRVKRKKTSVARVSQQKRDIASTATSPLPSTHVALARAAERPKRKNSHHDSPSQVPTDLTKTSHGGRQNDEVKSRRNLRRISTLRSSERNVATPARPSA